MDCEAASERLPWLLSGGLEALEAEEVRGHVAGCARCQGEMDETRRAATVFGAHLPPAVILDLAWQRPVEAGFSELARLHLDGCAACRDELRLAEESRQLESAWTEAPPTRRPSVWRVAALPATLAAGLLLGFWWGTRGHGAAVDSPQSLSRIAALESELARLRALVTQRAAPATRAAVPRLNLPLFEILPSLVQRGAQEDTNDVVVPAAATEIALLLGTDAASGAHASLTLQSGAGKDVWSGEGLVAGPPGGYTVVLPVELLPDGRYTITVKPGRGPAVVYRLRVRHTSY